MGNIGDAAQSNGDIMRRLRELEGKMRELTSGRSLEHASIGAGGLRITGAGGLRLQSGGDMRVEDGGDIVIEGGDLIVIGEGSMQSEDFDGDITTGDPGSTGWALGNDRLALLGAMVVAVDTFSGFDYTEDYALTTTETVRASKTIPVPSWAKEASVLAIAVTSANNASGATDYLWVRCRIDGLAGGGIPTLAEDGRAASATVPDSRVIDVSAKSSLTVEARVWSDFGTWPASTGNWVNLTVQVLFRSAP